MQQALLIFKENWRNTLDNMGSGAAILIDLSKVFDTLKQDLLIPNLLHCYLTKR